VIVDLVRCAAGYFGDCCSTIAIGDVPAEVRSAHARLTDALERSLAAVAPGVVAGELDAIARAGLEYPHHTGHGVGVAAHEERLNRPLSHVPISPGVVVAPLSPEPIGAWGARRAPRARHRDGQSERARHLT
jgi:Xaa-Pro aminopeptidase